MGTHGIRHWPDDVKELQVGDYVKKTFIAANSKDSEAMWIKVLCVRTFGALGQLINTPAFVYVPPLDVGDLVAVNTFEIIDWTRDGQKGS